MLDSSIILFGVLFLGVVLLVEGAWYYYQDVYAPRTRVGRRLETLKSGVMREQVESSLKMSRSDRGDGLLPGFMTRTEGKLTQAGISMTAERFVMLMGVATLALAIATPVLLGFANMLNSGGSILLVLVFAVGVGCVIPLALLDRKATKRIKKFEEQFPVALDIFVRGLRAGHPVTGALDLLVEEMPDPSGSEFATVIAEVAYGADLRDALEALAVRVQTTDVQMFAVCVAIQAETGGNLADILEGLANVIRERNSMVLKVRALASEGKMTAVVLSVLPIAVFGFIFMSNPDFYLSVAGDPKFMPGMLGLIGWYSVGMLTIRKLVTLKV
ncbi:type II secretion system F family protein [Sandaracinobacter neustonicus]|uniref:Type II secretion system F family protein n=1 Tax=Sandaracinobacter neustonicus TaxID=1715348 RepID=A0A501XMY1_9SPHN|nr:type II secretion system F family protein [Sandaracinobacter neustonicus]TPE61819.1 type II secretion system F family protein [Sandaracinobacter neustonicus]